MGVTWAKIQKRLTMFHERDRIAAAIFLDAPLLLITEACVPSTAPSALAPERPVIRCSRCRLVQYRTSQNRCRRCYLPLAVPVAAPRPVPQVPLRPNVATGVKSWRLMRGLTQKELAVASRLPRTYISRIENGRITPGLVTLERVAGALDVTLPVLLVPSASGGGSGHGHSNGNGNGNGHPSGNGNGYGNRGGHMAPIQTHGANGNGFRSGLLQTDACLREILRYSGILSGAQRRLVLFRVRELVSPHLV